MNIKKILLAPLSLLPVFALTSCSNDCECSNDFSLNTVVGQSLVYDISSRNDSTIDGNVLASNINSAITKYIAYHDLHIVGQAGVVRDYAEDRLIPVIRDVVQDAFVNDAHRFTNEQLRIVPQIRNDGNSNITITNTVGINYRLSVATTSTVGFNSTSTGNWFDEGFVRTRIHGIRTEGTATLQLRSLRTSNQSDNAIRTTINNRLNGSTDLNISAENFSSEILPNEILRIINTYVILDNRGFPLYIDNENAATPSEHFQNIGIVARVNPTVNRGLLVVTYRVAITNNPVAPSLPS